MKLNKKKQSITLLISRKDVRIFFKQIEKAIGVVKARKLRKVVDKEIREMKKHFKVDKWDLRYNLIEEDIVQQVLGPVGMYLLGRVIVSGHHVQSKKDKLPVSWFITRSK